MFNDKIAFKVAYVTELPKAIVRSTINFRLYKNMRLRSTKQVRSQFDYEILTKLAMVLSSLAVRSMSEQQQP
jgi:hypothetical protein